MVYPNEFKWCKTDIPCSMDYECEKCPFYLLGNPFANTVNNTQYGLTKVLGDEN